MTRYQIKFAYHGKGYHGFQMQPRHLTIQSALELVCYKILGEKINIVASGRTDTGVHALAQVAHFDVKSDKALMRLSGKNILYNFNAVMPDGIRILSLKKIRDDIHARLHAKSKKYVYHILIAPYENPFLKEFVWCVHKPLDLEAMQTAAQYLIGRHDFSAFCASDSNAQGKVRNLIEIQFSKRKLAPDLALPDEAYLSLRFIGEGFLKQMVRNMVGTLVDVGLHKTKPAVVKQILKSKDRRLAGQTAPAQGLFMKKVSY